MRCSIYVRDKEAYTCDMEPPEEILRSWRARKDNQIMGLEILSIALGFCTFANDIAARDVIIYSDNTGAEHAVAKGMLSGVPPCTFHVTCITLYPCMQAPRSSLITIAWSTRCGNSLCS